MSEQGPEFSPVGAGGPPKEGDVDKEPEFRARMEYLGRDEQYARRDPELQLLMFPENSQDINKSIVRVLEKYTDFDKREANSPYKIQYYMDAADAGVFIFGHSPEDLKREGYIKGSIGEDGYLEEGGKPIKFGYAIKVDTEKKEPPVKEERERRYKAWTENTKQTHYIPKFDAEGKIESLQPIQVDVKIEHSERTEEWEETSHPIITVEKFDYGTENKRKELHLASKAGYERLVNTAREYTLFSVLEDMRADISGYITTTYLKLPHISNEQWSQIFNSPDIAKITPEDLENNKYGWRIDKAMRMMDLLGHAETKGKMEDFMNKPTFEKIIEAVKDRALEIMDKTGHKDDEAKNMSDEQKVARFLIGEAAVQEENGRWTLNGLEDNGEPRIDRWNTDEERDPSKATQEEIEWWETEKERDPSKATQEEIEWWEENDKKYSRGFDVVEHEKEVRGFLTEFGNVYARPEQNLRDKINLMFSKIALLLEDKGAVRDADRYFQITGLRDEANLEVLAKRPSVEEIIEAHKLKGEVGYDEWRKEAKKWLKWFSLPGDPTASDLSKIFYPDYFRLKDILKDRPAGPILTVYDYDRFAQSMFSLGRSDIKIDGKKEKQTRSILEQWRGYAEGEGMLQEKANDLGDIDWNAIKVPDKIEGLKVKDEIKELTEEKEKEKVKKLLEVSKQAIPGSLWSYYTLMNWLAGRDNKMKAPWLFVLDETENLPLLRIASTYTNKEKFLSIVWHGPAVTWGKWRHLYIKYKNENEKVVEKRVKKHLSDKEEEKTQKGKRDWYKGVRNLSNFPEIMAQKVKIVKASKTGIGTYEVTMLDRVEGRLDEPGLAVKFGFLTKEELQENETKRLQREQDLR